MALSTREYLARPMPTKTTWGRWTKDDHWLVFDKDGRDYPVDLTEMTNPVETLDWIRHIAGKTWVTSQDLGDFVRALQDLIPSRPRKAAAERAA